MDKPGKMLVTIRPGPVLHVWRDGVEVARVPLTNPAAVGLAEAILAQVRFH